MSVDHVLWDLAAGSPRRLCVVSSCHVKEVQIKLMTVSCQGSNRPGSVLVWTCDTKPRQTSTFCFQHSEEEQQKITCMHFPSLLIMGKQRGDMWLLSTVLTFYFKPAHLSGKNGWAARLFLCTAVAQNLFPVISSCRTVRGSLDHGDGKWTQKQQLDRPHHHLHHLRGVCSADSGHPAGHGGFVGLPACLAPALVGGVACGSFPQVTPSER